MFVFPVFLCLFFYVAQKFWVHRNDAKAERVKKVELSKETDYETFFAQTGLGKEAVDELLETEDWESIRKAQNAFLSDDTVECVSVFGWITRSDRIDSSESVPIVKLKSGDILVSFSTHSMGWRHGHAGLAVSENKVLECTSFGKNSRIVGSKHWRKYSNYVVLRVKDATKEEKEKVVEYACENLLAVPYRVTAGFIGEKAADITKPYFGLQCAYLVWYAWQSVGIDLDSNGGRLVTVRDVARSRQLEIVQIYGMCAEDIY